MEVIINGDSVPVPEGPSDVPLVSFIRDHVGLKGTKFGCGVGQCGACTVHLDGQAARSCLVSVGDAAGAAVTTIEGLAATVAGDGLHPIQTAWIDEGVPQCGYCQAGQIMAAAALLARRPNPGEDEIGAAMRGNLCRCGTYPRIRAAIRRAAGEGR